MINLTYLFSVILLLLFIILLLKLDSIKYWLSSIIFPKKQNDKKSYYVCPKCGSGDWKFPNPIKPAERMINLYQLVNNLFECKKCGHIGIFFVVDNINSIKFKKSDKIIKNKITNKQKLTLMGWIILFLAIILIFFSANLLWIVILLGGAGILISKYGVAKEN